MLQAYLEAIIKNDSDGLFTNINASKLYYSSLMWIAIC